MARRRSIGCALVAASISLLPVQGPPAFAMPASNDVSFAVTRFDDPLPNTCSATDCSLREAIIAANSAPGHDSIILGAGTYQLTIPGTSAGAAAGDLNISGDLTIAGTGVSSTLVSGALLGDRVLNVAASRVVTVQGLTIRDATSGGVLNSGDLTMANVSVTMNTTGPLTGGGGIDNAAALTLANVTVSGNRAGTDGGGIFNSGTVTLTNVTLSGNKGDRGGGLYTGPGGTLRLENSMVANNIDASPSNQRPDCLGPLVSGGYNFVENAAGCAGITGAGDITALDPKLGPLLDNGGPTPTQAPAADSPLIDAGNPATAGSGSGACTASDQRGAPRALGVRCDIGAVEQVLCLGTPVRSIGSLGDDTLVGTI